MDRAEKIRSALYGGIVGDALGVPVEFTERQELSLCAVKNMVGYGRYDQPEGTWSDDTSLTLCTMESLARGYDIDDMGRTFCKWLFESYLTPTGYVFDAGLTTFMALDRIRAEGASARTSGCGTDDDIGNGSLMRMLPAALYFAGRPVEQFIGAVHEVSAITHAHPRAKVACGIYALIVRELLDGNDKETACRAAAAAGRQFYEGIEEFRNELHHFDRVLSCAIAGAERDSINSSGYVVDTLEASLWCLLRNNDTHSVLLAAVNLGLDTDTTGMVAGGLAGLCHGLASVPPSWLDSLARKEDIDTMISCFVDACVRKTGDVQAG